MSTRIQEKHFSIIILDGLFIILDPGLSVSVFIHLPGRRFVSGTHRAVNTTIIVKRTKKEHIRHHTVPVSVIILSALRPRMENHLELYLSPLNKGTKHGALQSSWWNPRSPRCRWLVWGEKLNGVLSSCKEPRRETTRHPEINPDPNNFFFFLFFMKLMLYSSFKSRTLLTTFLLPLFNHSMRS
jgi:hypothetical protein